MGDIYRLEQAQLGALKWSGQSTLPMWGGQGTGLVQPGEKIVLEGSQHLLGGGQEEAARVFTVLHDRG